MAAAANLTEAAHLANDNLWAKNTATTLYVNFSGFVLDLIAIFPTDGTQAERTVSNWLVIAKANQTNVAPTAFIAIVPVRKFMALVLTVYRLCFAALNAANANRITAGQSAAILAAYNARFG